MRESTHSAFGTALTHGSIAGATLDPNAYAKQEAYAKQAPRELGLVEQVAGLSGGLAELRGRLIGLTEKIAGMPRAADEAKPAPSGLLGHLSEAQSELRACYELVLALDRVF